MRSGRFREDLFYRLDRLRFDIPPLRLRQEEIPALTSYYFDYYKQKAHKPALHLSPDVVELMKGYAWPGNIRELKAEIERFVIYAKEGELIGPEKLSASITGVVIVHPCGKGNLPSGSNAVASRDDFTLRQAIEEVESRVIIETLQKTQWNLSRAAKMLKLTRTGLRKKLRRLKIEKTMAAGCGH